MGHGGKGVFDIKKQPSCFHHLDSLGWSCSPEDKDSRRCVGFCVCVCLFRFVFVFFVDPFSVWFIQGSMLFFNASGYAFFFSLHIEFGSGLGCMLLFGDLAVLSL